MGKRGPAVGQYRQHISRDLDVVRRFMDGESLAEIGRSLGVTRERIRQIVWREVGENSRKIRAKNRARLVSIRDITVPTERCVVCWKPMAQRADGRRRTCGKQCYKDYQIIRYHIEPGYREVQRKRAADWIMRHPDSVPGHLLRYYTRVANGEPIKKRGGWTCKGSKAEYVLARVMAERQRQNGDWHIEFPQAERP